MEASSWQLLGATSTLPSDPQLSRGTEESTVQTALTAWPLPAIEAAQLDWELSTCCLKPLEFGVVCNTTIASLFLL